MIRTNDAVQCCACRPLARRALKSERTRANPRRCVARAHTGANAGNIVDARRRRRRAPPLRSGRTRTRRTVSCAARPSVRAHARRRRAASLHARAAAEGRETVVRTRSYRRRREPRIEQEQNAAHQARGEGKSWPLRGWYDRDSLMRETRNALRAGNLNLKRRRRRRRFKLPTSGGLRLSTAAAPPPSPFFSHFLTLLISLAHAHHRACRRAEVPTVSKMPA